MKPLSSEKQNIKNHEYSKIPQSATPPGNSRFEQSEAEKSRASIFSKILRFFNFLGSRIIGSCIPAEPRAANRSEKNQKTINSIEFSKKFESLKSDTTSNEPIDVPTFKNEFSAILMQCKNEAAVDMEGLPPIFRVAALETMVAMDPLNFPTLALRNIDCTAGDNDYHHLVSFLGSPVALKKVTYLKLAVHSPSEIEDHSLSPEFSLPIGKLEKLKDLEISVSHKLLGHIDFSRSDRTIASVSLSFTDFEKTKPSRMYQSNFETALACILPKTDKITLNGRGFDLDAVPRYVYHNNHVKQIILSNPKSCLLDSPIATLRFAALMEQVTSTISPTKDPNKLWYEYRPRTGGKNIFGEPKRASYKVSVSILTQAP